MGEIKAAEARVAMSKTSGTRTKPEDPVSHDIRKYATWPQQDGQPEGYRRRLLDSDEEDELALLPVDQRAAARSAKVIRRYVPSVAPERTAPPPEDPARMHAWLGRVVPVPAPAQSASSKAAAKRQSKAADKRRRKTDHVKAVKGGRTLDQWLKGTRSADTAGAAPAAPRTLPLPRDNPRKRPSMSAPSTSTTAPRGEGRLESGRKRAREHAVDQQTSALDLARIRAAEYERLRPERKKQEAQRQQDLAALYPGYESGDTGNSEWAYRRDTQRFMVAWVGDGPRWPGWLPEAAWAIPKSRRSPEQYSEGRTEWLLRRQQGEERSEAGRVRKRVRQEDPRDRRPWQQGLRYY